MKVTRHTTIQSKKVAVPESYRKARSLNRTERRGAPFLCALAFSCAVFGRFLLES